METSSLLNSTQKYAAAALFSLALHQSQIHQTRPWNALKSLEDEDVGEGASVGKEDSVSENPNLWIHDSSNLLNPVLKFIGVEEQTVHGLKETAASSSQVRHHVGSFLTLLAEDSKDLPEEKGDKEIALAKSVHAMVLTLKTTPVPLQEAKNGAEYEAKCRENHTNIDKNTPSIPSESTQHITTSNKDGELDVTDGKVTDNCVQEKSLLSSERKLTVLYELIAACVAYNIEDEKKCLLGRGYDARHRVALRLLATWLDISWEKMVAMETILAYSLISHAKEDSKEETNPISPTSTWDTMKKGGIVGAAALTGGALMAITGGLAAPAIAQGIGALGLASVASATGSFTGSMAVAASFGVAGVGLAGSKMVKRVGEIDEFEFKAIGPNHNQGRLAVGIFISGLAFEDEDFTKPWEGCKDYLESYAIRWESENLFAVSSAIEDWIASKIATELLKGGAMMTVLSTLLTALALPASLVTASDLIDSKWAIALDRADKAGALLAEVLLKGLQGNRPVTLVGFSLGARVIFKCIQCLAGAAGNSGVGLIERAVLLGAPISIKDEDWESVRKVVVGRFVNAYSTNDWTLAIAFRVNLLSQGLAGIQPVEVQGIENVDVTQLLEGHSSYLWNSKHLIDYMELDSYYPVFHIPVSSGQEKTSSVKVA
uniref:Transmembrane and coiled-coil domain-containing protein 4 n=1 Tax=Kalanchoe fedtschenkoi TaxID=63787 RepID=A0A7N0R899_KALFE